MSEIVGFDFGTTNSVMSVVVGNRCISLLDDKMPHPSVVCYQGNQVIVGRKAKEQLGNAGRGVVGNIVKSPKTMLGLERVNVDGHTYSPRRVVADVVGHVRRDALRQVPEAAFDRAVVTIPVDMDGARRRELREACRIAGLNIAQFVHEPLAALYGHLRGHTDFEGTWRRLNRKLILVFDWGGGTLDLTLCRVVDGMLVQMRNLGISDVGGDVLDDMLVHEVERLALSERGIARAVGHQVGARPRLRTAAETAKVALSSKDVHTILVTDYFRKEAGDTDIALRLKRKQLEACLDEAVHRGVDQIHLLLEGARIDSSAIEMCLATGGMVNMPLIQARLHEIFGPQRVHVSERGNSVISEGAAWIAHDRARLNVACNIEVMVARQTYFPVIKAGSPMPREGEVRRQEFSMYCVDPRDGVAKFLICAPKRRGRAVQTSDQRDVIGTLAVDVSKDLAPFRERLALSMTIDENLILHAEASSTIERGADRVEIHTLEFGLVVGGNADSEPSLDDSDEAGDASPPEPGGVLIRANVSDREADMSLVPGELMKEINPYYFDRRRDPPEIQNFEKLTYQPCAECRKVRCVCAAVRAGLLPPPDARMVDGKLSRTNILSPGRPRIGLECEASPE